MQHFSGYWSRGSTDQKRFRSGWTEVSQDNLSGWMRQRAVAQG